MEVNDQVRLRGRPASRGVVLGSTLGGQVIVQWVTTASGEPLTHGLTLNERPEDLEVVPETSGS